MNIEQIFEKRLDRNINGVVKAEQTDDASAWIELSSGMKWDCDLAKSGIYCRP